MRPFLFETRCAWLCCASREGSATAPDRSRAEVQQVLAPLTKSSETKLGFTRTIHLKQSFTTSKEHHMSNTIYSSSAFNAASASAGRGLLRELFAATPLYIFYTAVKSALATR
jgi:hypothetical protein